MKEVPTYPQPFQTPVLSPPYEQTKRKKKTQKNHNSNCSKNARNSTNNFVIKIKYFGTDKINSKSNGLEKNTKKNISLKYNLA